MTILNPIFFALCLSMLSMELVLCQNDSIETNIHENIVYGERHIFTIETPQGWINDIELARQFGLVCFFYPLEDSVSDFNNYMYALGIDKLNTDESIDDFIQKDLVKFGLKYPNYSFDTLSVTNPEGIADSRYYSFANLSDRYKEEVCYNETNSAFIILSFTAKEKHDYEKYRFLFDDFIKSFQYKGDNPQAVLN